MSDRCPKCNGKGWVERYYGTGNTFTPSLEQCPERCNIGGYSKEVQKRMRPEHVAERPVLRSV